MGEGTDRVEEAEGDDGSIEDIRKQLLEAEGTEADEELLEDFRERLADREDVKGGGTEDTDGLGGESSGAKEEQSEERKRQEKEGEGSGETSVKVDDTKQGEEPDQAAGSGEAEKTGAGSNAQPEALSEEPTGADAYVFPAKERSTVGEGEGPQAQVEHEEPTQEARPAQIEPESHTRNDDQLLVTEQASPGQGWNEQMETRGLQHFQPEAQEWEKPRVLEAVDYGKGANLRVPMGDLEQAGYEPPDHNSIVQLGLKPEGSRDVETVFARYRASDHRAEAYVGDIGGEKGSRYELVEARGVDEDRLVREFERGKCEHLDNVRLEHDGGRMFVNVDGRGVELEDYKVATSGSHLVMRGRLDGDDRCKIEFDGRRASAMFARDYPVEGMRMEGDELVVRYEQSRNEAHEHRQSLDHSDIGDGKLSLGELQKPDALRLARLLDAPEGTDGVYTFAVDKRLQESVRSVLEEAMKEGTRRYGVVKGEVGESLISNLMSLAGWDRIERHPFNETRKEGVTGNGTDHVFRDPDHKLSISESKYWGQIENALKRGEIQVGAYYDRRRKYHGEEIERGYVMAMDWNLSDDPIRIHVRRVRPVVNSNV